MQLTYCIPGKIWWITEFLPPEVYKGIHDAIIKERDRINLQSASKVWDSNLYWNHRAPDRVAVSQYPPFDILKQLTRKNDFFELPFMETMTTTIHFMRKGSGINWHSDVGWKYGATFYVNRRWNIHWGGEFMFANKEAHGFLPITGNSLVILKAPFDHKVNPVISPTMPRISVQMFMK